MNMYIRLSVIFHVLALVVVAAAAPVTFKAPDSQCNTGPIQCCVDTYTRADTTVAELTGLLGISLPNAEGLIGLGCTPITVGGSGSDAVCNQQPVCCTDDIHDGLVHLGCSPLNLNLRKAGRLHDGARLVAAALDVSSFFPYWFD